MHDDMKLERILFTKYNTVFFVAKYHILACPQYLFISSGLKFIYCFVHFIEFDDVKYWLFY
jgi:hypothetical protein